MVVKIYRFPASQTTRAITLTLKEPAVPHEFVIAKVREGKHKSSAYLEETISFGQITVLADDDGFQVFEIRAIARYLIAKYVADRGLVSKDLKKNAIFEQAMSTENNNFTPYAFSLAVEVLKPY